MKCTGKLGNDGEGVIGDEKPLTVTFYCLISEDGFAVFIGSATQAANIKALVEAGVKYHYK
jgi:hypothetical protein